MATRDLDQNLASCPLFRSFSSSERLEILGLLELQTFKPGETIIHESQSLQFIWFLVSGQCQVIKIRDGGGEHELSVLETGGVFGEMSFFQPAPHSASVRAVGAVEVGRLPREKYDMLLRIGSLAAYKLAFNTVGVLSERLRKMDSMICDLLHKTNPPQQHAEWRDFQAKLYSGWDF